MNSKISRNKWTVILLLVAAVVAACGDENSGPASQAVEAAKKAVEANLKDPLSVQYRNVKAYKPINIVCGEFNAKNSMGGYVGFTYFIYDKAQGLTTGDSAMHKLSMETFCHDQ